MIDRKSPLHSLALYLSAALAVVAMDRPVRAEAPVPKEIDFNRDVRSILSNNCYACHGPDKNKRKADLRLDTEQGIRAVLEDRHVTVPGHPEKSELFLRVTTQDPDDRMPDPKSNKKLSNRDIAVLKKWIEQGVAWKGHWAYLKLAKPEVPAQDDANEKSFVKNEVDRFILAKLKENELRPAPEADRATLLRRVSFDLTGLPPTPEEVAAFVNDSSSDAYEKQVDRLMASPHFGERMAMYWLDLVRYADSIGYHSDNPMNVSPYRDWVINALNQNEPFDRFTTEQLAGDLLPDSAKPDPTLSQKVASAYNRLLQTTEEGGAQPKEYEAKYAADRVRNVSTVWLGSTMGCCQCHDHKFDPFTTKDFYSMAAFFADVQEAAVGRREPGIPVPDPRQTEEVRKIDESIADAKKKLDEETPELTAARADWEKKLAESGQLQWKTLEVDNAEVQGESKLRKDSDGILRDVNKVAATETYTLTAHTDLAGITGFRLEALPDDELPDHGPGTAPNGNFVLTEFKVAVAPQGGKPRPIKLVRASADHSQDGFNVASAIDGKGTAGWAILPEVGKAHAAVFQTAGPLKAEGDSTQLTFTLEFKSPYPQHNIGKLRLSVTAQRNPAGQTVPQDVVSALAVAAEKRSEQQNSRLAAYYRTISPILQTQREAIAQLEKKKNDLLTNVPKCLVTTAGSPRTVHILPRGNWLDETGPIVEPAIPHFLGQLDVAGRRANRLDLARWIVSKDNPLTARVFVNRQWKLFFGQGISKILDDLGSQGEWPTHPELIDWLAADFMESGWDIKHTVRLLVTSGTYRQTSMASPEAKEIDPYNRLFAHQSRYRLDAEMVRDNALAISGLLVDRVGGPSVFPYQPAGYWFALNFPTREWKNDTGDGLYRRGLYTHWQRSFLHPSLLAFDAPTREEAVCERARSNIPQQALVLLNDPTYVEAARVLAERIIKQGGSSVPDRIAWAFNQALDRKPRPEESAVLAELYAKHAAEYASDQAAAKDLLSIGDHPIDSTIEPAELAAWTSVARAILNLHETITRY